MFSCRANKINGLRDRFGRTRSFRFPASSLTTIASRLAPTGGGWVSGSFVVAWLAADVHAMVVTYFAGAVHAVVVTDFAGAVHAMVVTDFAGAVYAVVVTWLVMGATASGRG